MATVTTFKDKTKWLEARHHGIGASEAAAVLGAGLYGLTPIRLYMQKLGLATEDREQTEAMELGLLMEPVLAGLYRNRTDRSVSRTPLSLIRSRECEFMVASPDGFVDDTVRGRGGIEFKNVAGFRGEEWDEEPPLAFQIQCQHSMFVADLSWWSIGVLIGGRRFRWFDLDRNDRFLKTLVEREQEFWSCIQRKEPPAIDGSMAASELIRAMYPKPEPGRVVELGQDAAEWAQALETAKVERKRWEEMERQAKNNLAAEIGDAEIGVLPDGTTYTYKLVEKREHMVKATSYRELRRKA